MVEVRGYLQVVRDQRIRDKKKWKNTVIDEWTHKMTYDILNVHTFFKKSGEIELIKYYD